MDEAYPTPDDDEPQRVTSDVGQWAMVPAWVREGLTDGKLDGTALGVFCLLAEKADHNGDRHDFRSVKTLATEIGVNPGTVRRALMKLRDIGAVDWTHRERKDGSMSTNDYTISFARTPAHPRAPYNDRAPTRALPARQRARVVKPPSSQIPNQQTPAADAARAGDPALFADQPRDNETDQRAGTENARSENARAAGPSTEAWQIAGRVMEQRKPPPPMGQRRVAVEIEKFLASGHDPRDVERAALAVRTFSFGWLESELNARKSGRVQSSVTGARAEGPVRRGVWSDD